ncbi:DUF6090 family protein [Sediminicola sp. YIK13]|uniref:DUF6090 family protein n=1 Tax=Sediminicola sp. YIK13 TaxID=1453352 RepID=UPI0007857A46|nr:DUF6090 family protein [Sediminicola sp. YIK13]
MIKFFRKIRQNLLSEGKTEKYLKYAVGEIILVVIGILIALSINNWNENRKKIAQEQSILERLQADITSDLIDITSQMGTIKENTKQLSFCVDVILGNSESNLLDFRKNFSPILSLTFFDQNKTTFNNIVSSEQIEVIKNKKLADSITKYYNFNYKGWDTAMLDYTRNIIAPFMLNFDHMPLASEGTENENFTKIDINNSKIIPKTIKDYQEEVFILNSLRQKIYNMEGQQLAYENLKIYMGKLLKQLNNELEYQK